MITIRKLKQFRTASSTFVTDIEDLICWRQVLDIVDDFIQSCHQQSLSLQTNWSESSLFFSWLHLSVANNIVTLL